MGASVCASGSQVWNGNIGTLMAKAKKNPQNSHTFKRVRKMLRGGEQRGDVERLNTRLVFCALKYSARMPSSISTEPAKVYRKNLMAAYRRRSLPQTPIRKYIGTSMTSQKT